MNSTSRLDDGVVTGIDRGDGQGAQAAQAKMLSVMTAPPSSPPMVKPAMVTTGIRVLLSAWRRTTETFAGALGAGGADVIAGEHVQHVGAHQPPQPGGRAGAQRQRRQDQAARRKVADHRQPAQGHGKQQHEHQAKPEGGHGGAEDRQHPQQVIHPRILPVGGDHADEQAQQHDVDKRGAGQRQRDRQRHPQPLGDELVGDAGAAQVALGQVD